ncbi:lipid-binding SYLF domain-containing protein [Arenibacter algicola]|uniref:lipid-binding SYLF domain-containing protein n=1 Tax=Arenibacter algicola TaxID=616991 RepID=UPI001C07CB97|nr:lipid-binding SYLF domain-containing protein [Arenibacter algicola]MBU2905942.1 lipid-binding SYLF domain-containing protein [Arenibacter algicola]
MKIFKSLTLALILIVTGLAYSQKNDTNKLLADAENAKQKMIQQDQGLKKFFNNASGYVIFPNVGEGGLIVGAASGKGIVYEKGNSVGIASLKKLDIGVQAGGQALAQVIFFETKEALNEFKTDDYAFSAEVSAVVIESGASQNANYNDGVVVFTMPKAGLMVDASVGGQKFDYEPFK